MAVAVAARVCHLSRQRVRHGGLFFYVEAASFEGAARVRFVPSSLEYKCGYQSNCQIPLITLSESQICEVLEEI